MAIQMRKLGIKNPLKLKYNIKNMITISGGSIAGGIIGGVIGADRVQAKRKLKEGTFQFFNATIPTLFVGLFLRFQDKLNCLKPVPAKIAGVLLGIAAGMYVAVKISDKIFDPHDKEPDRKIKIKDCVVSADELLGALVIAKFPIVDKLHAEKILPLIYTYCGYRAGNAK